MRRIYYFPYLSLLVILGILTLLSSTYIQKLRSKTTHKVSSLCKIKPNPASTAPNTAQVVLREPAFWNFSFWIDHRHIPQITKNDPVLFQGCLIGVIETIGEKQAEVRLITDPNLTVSVRVVRGDVYNFELIRHVEALELALYSQKGLFPKKKEEILRLLALLNQELTQEEGNLYLAKGEIHGLGAPMWRLAQNTLKGIGFNYDHADSEGPPRDIRTGLVFDSLTTHEKISLIRVGDLLVTTGFDGLFPPDLPVAIVTKVNPLTEGASFYTIEAVAAAGNLDDIRNVQVLPSK